MFYAACSCKPKRNRNKYIISVTEIDYNMSLSICISYPTAWKPREGPRLDSLTKEVRQPLLEHHTYMPYYNNIDIPVCRSRYSSLKMSLSPSKELVLVESDEDSGGVVPSASLDGLLH